MATKGKKGKSAGGGVAGVKKAMWSVITIVMLASSVVGWAKVNSISTIEGAYSYFRSLSDRAFGCGDDAGSVSWWCSTPKADVNATPGKLNVPSAINPATGKIDPAKLTKDSAASDMLTALEQLKAAPANESVAYKRTEWRHWIGMPCDTRRRVLIRDGKDVKSTQTATKCTIESGKWTDPYTGDVFTNSRDIDIDHVVPLSWAAKNGGNSWDPAKKQLFANDMSQLLAVGAAENRGKGDKGPSEYMPPRREFQCEYSKTWVATLTKYGLSIPEADKMKLKDGLQKCG